MPRLVAISNTQIIANLAYGVFEDASRADIDNQLVADWTAQYGEVELVYDPEVRAEPGDTWSTDHGVANPYVPAAPSAIPVQIYGISGEVQQNEDKSILTSVLPREGTELILVTHNYCDPTTWYSTSERSEAETLTDSGDGLTWTSGHENWIDLIHGKMFDEDALAADVAHNYAVSVTVDGDPVEARGPFSDSGGAYMVDYSAGTITFFASQSGKAVVASYSYAVDSTWIMVPDAGARIDIENVEAQFSSDVVLRDTINFTIYAYNPEDLPNKIPYVNTAYKSMRNFIDEAQGSYPVIPAIGGPEGRGTAASIYGFPFRYGTIRKMLSSVGMELRVKLTDDRSFGGEHATATFYCTVKEEG